MVRTVAIIATQLGVGGAERQLYLWLQHVDRQLFRPVVVNMHGGLADYWEAHIEALGVSVLGVRASRNKLARALAATRALRPWKPVLVHAWHLAGAPYAAVAGALARARCRVGSLRGSYQAYRSLPAHAFVSRQWLDGLIVNSPAAAREIAKWQPRQRLFLVPNAVEDASAPRLQARQFLSARFGIPDCRVWLGSVGRFERNKQFEILIEIATNLLDRGQNIHLLLIGAGSEYAALKAKVARSRIEARVTFTGELPDARRWLSALDVFCFPSVSEGMPNVVLEAAIAELPVVAWGLPFVEDVLSDGESARLVTCGATLEMEKAISDLVMRPEERRRLGLAARGHVRERFGVDVFRRRLAAVYDQLLGERAAATARSE